MVHIIHRGIIGKGKNLKVKKWQVVVIAAVVVLLLAYLWTSVLYAPG